jgi:hypothetical protein
VRPFEAGERPEQVLVVETLGAPAPMRRRLRKAKPERADAAGEPAVPVTRVTVIDSGELEPGGEDGWFQLMRAGEDARDEFVQRALLCTIRALAAQRTASANPGVPDPSLDSAVAVRVGYGEGDDLVEGRWADAIDLPREARRRTRGEALRPQERMAAIVGGRADTLACEELLLRARADLDAGRTREAALQLRVGLEALLAARSEFTQAGQDDDLGFLNGRRTITGEAANEALRAALTDARTAEVAETLSVCERVLRRRAARG